MRRRALKKECKEIKELETMDTRIESMRVDLCWQLVHEQREVRWSRSLVRRLLTPLV